MADSITLLAVCLANHTFVIRSGIEPRAADNHRDGTWRAVADAAVSSRVAVRPIRIVGDPVLTTRTRRVEEFDDDLRTLVEDMFETMAAAHGVGLAANQVGVDLRVFVYDCPDEEGKRARGVVVNPVLETSARPETMPIPTTTRRAASPCPASSSRPAARTGRG